MKKEIHPENYRLCVFKDMSNGYAFITRSCAETKENVQWEDGNEYPLVKLDISMTSHPSSVFPKQALSNPAVIRSSDDCQQKTKSPTALPRPLNTLSSSVARALTLITEIGPYNSSFDSSIQFCRFAFTINISCRAATE
jgi:ribosomal protein L31